MPRPRLSAEGDPVPLLASIPLSVSVRVGGDAGVPVVLSDPSDAAAMAISGLAERLAVGGRERNRSR